MSEHPNAALVRAGLDAVNSGDPTRMADMLADDVEWHEIGRDEPTHGKAALLQRFTDPAVRDFEITSSLHDVTASDEHVVALVNAHATRGGRTLDYRTAEIMHVRDGKVTARWAFSDDTAAIVAFFG